MREAAAAYAAQAGRARRERRRVRHDGEPHDWPLWEVFVRVAPRALATCTSASCTRPTPRWRCATPATSTPAARRASRSGSCPPPRSPRQQPGREGRVLRPGRRQDLPAPDVLRRPRRGASTCDACPTSFDLRRSRPRRRRARLRPAAGLVDQPRAAARGGRRAGQHRPRPARPGPLAAALRRRGRGRRPQRGRPRLPARRARVPQRAARRAAATATSRSRWRGCCSSRPTSSSSTPRCARSADATLAGVAGKAVKEVAYHRRPRHASGSLRLGDGTDESHAPDAGRRSTPMWPYVDELFDADRPGALVADGVAVDPSTLRDAVLDAGSTAVLAEATLTVPEVTRRRSAAAARGLHTEAAGLPARRDAAPAPARTRGRRGDARTTLRAARGRGRAPRDRCSTPSCRSLTIEDLGILRDVDRGRRRPRRTSQITPTYSGCPAMDAIRADLERRADRGRLPARRRRARAVAGLDHRLDERRRPAQAARRTASRRRRAARATGRSPLALSVRCPQCGQPRHPRVEPVRLDRVQVAVGVPGLPRALRPLQGALTVTATSRSAAPVAGRTPLARSAAIERAHRRRGRGHLRRARRAARTTTRSPHGQHLDRSGGGDDVRRSYSICTPPSLGRAADRRQAAARRRVLDGRRSTRCRSATSST